MKQKNRGDLIFELCIVAGVIFLSLKLTNVLDAPYILAILPLALYGVLCIIVLVVALAAAYLLNFLSVAIW